MPAVRPGTAADLPALRRIQAAAIAEPWPDLLELATGSGPILRVVDADRVAGYAVALVGGEAAYVPELAVDPGRQGAGFGSALLSSLVEELAAGGVERCTLTARAGDDRTRSFYESRGFVVADRLPDHFADGDGFVYERTIRTDDG
jgi:ribosomal-protein-alanine N-acetyltransferase